jgi:hypothetical protein
MNVVFVARNMDNLAQSVWTQFVLLVAPTL